MTRSEEEVEFGKRTTQRAERVRLRKVLVEDEETKTVPVRKEVIQLETSRRPRAGSSPSRTSTAISGDAGLARFEVG